MRAVVAIYIDPDFYPPTINAILNLAEKMDEVVVISRNNSAKDYPYPSNVKLKKVGKFISVRDMEKSSLQSKVANFISFTLAVSKQAREKNTALVVLYDPFALLAFYLVKNTRRGKKIWYHNHDMISKSMNWKFSIGGFAAKFESAAMKHIDFFSLPSKERLQYFENMPATDNVFILPNYPSLKVYSRVPEKKLLDKEVKIIYQGFIGTGHSLENLILLLKEKINGFCLRLVLKGSVNAEYKSLLDSVARENNVSDNLEWIGIGPYRELPAITAACDIGIGINMNNDIVSQAQGTASNKIYEYAASGLPVLLYNTEQYTKYLGQYEWTFFTDGTVDSLRNEIEKMIENIPVLPTKATHDFETTLNFERFFMPALDKVLASVASL